MTNKEKKAYLYRYRNLESSIKRLLEEKERWQTRAEKMTPTLTGMPGGGNGEDQRELAICNMIDCANEAASKINEQIKLKAEIEKAIESVGDDRLELLLVYRYIDGEQWEDITRLLDCSWTHTHRLHAMALEKIKIQMA